MAMDDHITKMGYIIFTISILAAGLIPVAWNILGGQASLVEATSNSTSQTLSRDLFGTSGGTFSNASYSAPQLSVIPGHLDQISTASFTPGVFPLQVTLTGYGFGSTAPSSGQVNGQPAVTMAVGGRSFDSTSGITIASWSDSHIVFTLPSSFTQNPSGAISFSVYSTSNQNLATYTLNIPVVTVGNIQNTYVNGSTTITGNVQSSSGSAITNEPVVLTITAPDGTTQTVDTTTDGNGNFTTTYTPTQMGGYMVKAECESGVSNLYGNYINIPYSDYTHWTNNPANFVFYNPYGNEAWIATPSVPTTIPSGDTAQLIYAAPNNQYIASVYNNIIYNLASPEASIFYQGLNNGSASGSQQSIAIPYSGDATTPFTASGSQNTNGFYFSFDQNSTNIDGSWGFGSDIYVMLEPDSYNGSTSGSFAAEAPQLVFVGNSGTTEGQQSTATFNVSFNGKPVSNDAYNIEEDEVYTSAPGQSQVTTISTQTVTSNSDGTITVNYTIPTGYPTGTGYEYMLWAYNSYSNASSPWMTFSP